MLTIKSDDITGRYMAFQAIIKGLKIPESRVPESFKLLVRQLNGLCLAITPLKYEDQTVSTLDTTQDDVFAN